mgnify:CR=1 FL=1
MIKGVLWENSIVFIVGQMICRFWLSHRKDRFMTTMERKIKLSVDDVKKFVNLAMKCDFDIDIYYNHYELDAKSFLGVMGLDFSKVLTVRYAGYNEDFDQYLHQFAIAC